MHGSLLSLRRVLAVGALWASVALAQEETGRIAGSVTLADGTPLAAVTVRIRETDAAAVTDEHGRFSLLGVPAGVYELEFSFADRVVVRPRVTVAGGATANVDQTADWVGVAFDTLTVYSVSKRRERIVEAPAAVSRVAEEAIAREAAHGQAPKLVEFTPGAEITQSGLYDFNLNTRGFNNTLNRRVGVLIDGRQLARPNILAPSWTEVPFPLDDLAEVEFVRGPSGALYGVNSSSGVLNLTTRPPRYSQGGLVRLTVGELDTANLDFRWAGALGGDWYVKAVAGVRDTGDYSVSRVSSVEYSVPCSALATTDCIPLEAVPLDPEDDTEVRFAGLRVDKYWGPGRVLTLEGGTTHSSGPVVGTSVGRVQIDHEAPWGRINFTSRHWNFLGYYNEFSGPTLNLSPGTTLSDRAQHQLQLEVQGNWSWLDDRVLLVGGAAHSELRLNPDRLFRPAAEDRQAIYALVDWSVGERLKVVAAGRIDESNLYEARFFPRVAMVYSPTPLHTLRLTYSKAFEEPTLTEFFLRLDVAPPLDLSALQAAHCDRFAVDCGFGSAGSPLPTPVLALGNETLRLQETETVELGYTAVVGNKAYLTFDVYRGRSKDFVSSVLPQLGTPLGRVNQNFGPWEPPPGLPDSSRDAILQAVPLLSNGLDGSPIIAALSFGNFGDVDTRGAELGVNYYPDDHWALSLAYAWFDYDVTDQIPGTEDLLVPNTPKSSLAVGVTCAAERWDAGLSGRWVDGFRWSSGVFVGDVEPYAVVDLQAGYSLGGPWRLGLNVANLLDDSHFEKFGGDLLGRRALISVAYEW